MCSFIILINSFFHVFKFIKLKKLKMLKNQNYMSQLLFKGFISIKLIIIKIKTLKIIDF